MDRDCGDRECSVEYRLMANCDIFVAQNETFDCDYPCSFDNCVKEQHTWINCPIWFCQAKTTTSTTSSTTSTSTTMSSTATPTPLISSTTHGPQSTPSPAGPDCSGALCYTSLTFNIIVFLVCVALLFVFLRRKIRRRQLPLDSEAGLVNPLFSYQSGNLNQPPIIRYSQRLNQARIERLPLLPFHSTSSHATSSNPRTSQSVQRQRVESTSDFNDVSLSVDPSADQPASGFLSDPLLMRETHF